VYVTINKGLGKSNTTSLQMGGVRSFWAVLLLAMAGGDRVAVCRSVHLACFALENRGNKCPVCWFVTGET
jgi:hypothetical protein